jgi:hypothetical protein
VHHYDIVALGEQTLSSLTHIAKAEALFVFIYIFTITLVLQRQFEHTKLIKVIKSQELTILRNYIKQNELASSKWMFGDYKTFLIKFCDVVTINAYTKTNYKFLCDVKPIMVPKCQTSMQVLGVSSNTSRCCTKFILEFEKWFLTPRTNEYNWQCLLQYWL